MGIEGSQISVVDAVGDGDCPFSNLADLPVKRLEWIWDGFIPQGKLTLITGEPGVGKSLVALQVAAMVTRGLRAPVTARAVEKSARVNADTPTEPGSVLLFSADDDLADTVRPRLEAAGADLSRVCVLKSDFDSGMTASERSRGAGGGVVGNRGNEADDNSFRLERDLGKLEEILLAFQARGIDLRLIVIDPIDCYLNAAGTSRRDAANASPVVPGYCKGRNRPPRAD